VPQIVNKPRPAAAVLSHAVGILLPCHNETSKLEELVRTKLTAARDNLLAERLGIQCGYDQERNKYPVLVHALHRRRDETGHPQRWQDASTARPRARSSTAASPSQATTEQEQAGKYNPGLSLFHSIFSISLKHMPMRSPRKIQPL
jgi:hypothetical protein